MIEPRFIIADEVDGPRLTILVQCPDCNVTVCRHDIDVSVCVWIPDAIRDIAEWFEHLTKKHGGHA